MYRLNQLLYLYTRPVYLCGSNSDDVLEHTNDRCSSTVLNSIQTGPHLHTRLSSFRGNNKEAKHEELIPNIEPEHVNNVVNINSDSKKDVRAYLCEDCDLSHIHNSCPFRTPASQVGVFHTYVSYNKVLLVLTRNQVLRCSYSTLLFWQIRTRNYTLFIH